MKKDQDKNNSDIFEVKELGLNAFFLIGFGIIIIWAIFWVVTYFGINNWEDRGTFGDMFGAINSLFSGLALAGIIYTMLLQRQELRLQRLELKANREELARTATAQENSERALRQQAQNLKVTARLNALSTLMNYYSERAIKYINHHQYYNEANERYEECKTEIEEILKGKS